MQYLKKTIGTLALTIGLLAMAYFIVPAEARAIFINTMSGLNVDGQLLVVDISNNSAGTDSITLATSGAEPIKIAVVNTTNIIGGPLEVGDRVRVNARERNTQDSSAGLNTLVAKVIRKLDDGGYGYGFEGDSVLVNDARVTAKTDDTFTVRSAVALITFRVTPSTDFLHGDFDSLAIGDIVKVNGTDTGGDFVAQLVNIR